MKKKTTPKKTIISPSTTINTTNTANGSITVSTNGNGSFVISNMYPYYGSYTVGYPGYTSYPVPETYKSLWIKFLIKMRDAELRETNDYYNKIIGNEHGYYWH